MKAKLLICSVFASVLLLSLVSATITFPSVPTLSQTGNSGALTVATDQNETITFSGLSSISDGEGHTITFSVPLAIILNKTSSSINISYIISSGFIFDLGKEYSTTLTANGTISPAVSQKLSFVQSDFCKAGKNGSLSVFIDDINNKGIGTDDKWYPFDNIEIKVNVDNTGSDKVKDIVVKWELVDSDGKIIKKATEDKFSLSGDKEKDIKFTLTLDKNIDELKDDTYTLYVKAYSDDENEENQCSSDSESVDIAIESDLVIISEINSNVATLPCGDELQLELTAWNIGDTDQENVYAEITNKELGIINQRVDFGDIDSLTDETQTVAIKIPSNAKEQTYTLAVKVYDENDDIYENEEGENSESSVNIQVQGNCAAVSPKATIMATLQSGGKAGEELVIKAIITNTGESSLILNIESTNYEAWATLKDISPKILNLSKGGSKEVILSFDVNEDAEGEKNFNIVAISGIEKIAEQPVSVTIEKAKGIGLAGITGFAINQENWYLWGIGALNVLLIIIIIVVAIRVAKK